MKRVHHSGFDNYMLRYWCGVEALVFEDPDTLGLRVYLRDSTVTPPRSSCVRLTYDQLNGGMISAIDEAITSIHCHRQPPRDAGAFTQDDAIKLLGVRDVSKRSRTRRS